MKFEYSYHATFINRRELEEHLKLEREFQEWKAKKRSGELTGDEPHHQEDDIVEQSDPGYIVVGGYKSEPDIPREKKGRK